MRFNPPPNWPPTPPGWTPPPRWQPDPMWPAPPPGWQLWIEDAPKSRTPLIIGGVAVAVVVVIGVVLAFVLLGSGDDEPIADPVRTTESAPDATDEEQIEERVQDFETAWNNEDFDGIEAIVCDEIKGEPDFTEQDFLESRGDTGRLSLSFEGADINGDTAVVDIKEKGQTSAQQFDFAKEGGEWLWCEL